ncbi:MAG: hypothetical protein JO244_07665 [Solirubrobacterales bacterium]|nr:hypothetical protein [Solirubrobacterales bacterium]
MANVWLTARDRLMLSFLAEHRMVLESQLAALVGSSQDSLRPRLRRLAGAGYLARWRGAYGCHCCRIRVRGLRAIGSSLGPPEENLGAHRHDVGLAWLWLAARAGAFGPVAEVIGERRLRSHDMSEPSDPYSIRLGGVDRKGQQRRHYPDLLLIDAQGRRLALELELSRKEHPRREEILAGYAGDRRVDGVVYLVEDNPRGHALGRTVRAAADRMGASNRMHVRPVPPIEPETTPAERGRGSRLRGSDRSTARQDAAEAVL